MAARGQPQQAESVKKKSLTRFTALVALIITVTVLSARLRAETGTCRGASVTIPFMDVAGSHIFFCSIAAAYFSGLTNGTTSTTYNPTDPVLRDQMSAFVTRTLDQSLRRGSARASLGEWWTSQVPDQHFATVIGNVPELIVSDGTNVYASGTAPAKVTGVRANDGLVLKTYEESPIVTGYRDVLVAAGYLWATGSATNGGGVITRFKLDALGSSSRTDLGSVPVGIAFDGRYIWSANVGTAPNTGSISRIDIALSLPTTFVAGFNQPIGILYDGASLWVTDPGDDSGKRVDPATGGVLQTIPVGADPGHLIFDGTNLWVPCFTGNAVYVVRAVGSLRGTVLAALTGNGQLGPHSAAFDGERILVSNFFNDSVSLWKASDLTPIGNFSTGSGSNPTGVCCDGINFWVCLQGQNKIVRF
jgi:hypothetical protein